MVGLLFWAGSAVREMSTISLPLEIAKKLLSSRTEASDQDKGDNPHNYPARVAAARISLFNMFHPVLSLSMLLGVRLWPGSLLSPLKAPC